MAWGLVVLAEFIQIEGAMDVFENPADLDEDCQAVVGVPGCVQVVLVLLRDVWHQHVDQGLQRVVERHGETLAPGELRGEKRGHNYPV